MKKVYLLSLASVMLALASFTSAQTSDNLQHLVDTNGTLSIGDKTFSDFDYQAVGLTSFDASQLQATVSIQGGVYYFTLQGNISLVSGGTATADFLLNYDVSATGGQIDMIDQSFTGSAQPMNTSFVSIDENVRDGMGNSVAYSHLQNDDHSDPAAEPGDQLYLTPPQSHVGVTTDIGLGIADGGFVSISELRQSFHQTAVPEPATTAMLVMGVGGLGLLLRKKAQA